MTLPAAFPLSASQINVELGRAGNAAFDIQGAEERALAGVASGPIKMSDFLGKSSIGLTQMFANFDGSGSWASVPFGPVSSSRRIAIFGFHGDTATNPGNAPTLTIDGVNQTRVNGISSGNGLGNACGTSIFFCNPSTTSGTVALSWNAPPKGIVVVKMQGYGAVVDQETDTTDGQVGLNTSLGGCVLGCVSYGAFISAVSWAQLTKIGDQSVDPAMGSGNWVGWAWLLNTDGNAHNYNVSPNDGGGNNYNSCFASFSLL